MTIDYRKTTHDVEAAVRKAMELYEQEHGQEPSNLQVKVIAKAAEAREDLEIIAKVVRQHHPELSEAQVVSKALDAYPQLYDQMVS